MSAEIEQENLQETTEDDIETRYLIILRETGEITLFPTETVYMHLSRLKNVIGANWVGVSACSALNSFVKSEGDNSVFVMLYDDDGLMNPELKENRLAELAYGLESKIVGDVIICSVDPASQRNFVMTLEDEAADNAITFLTKIAPKIAKS